ncbi:MAG: GlxA family transcriptional regulator [bacterium]
MAKKPDIDPQKPFRIGILLYESLLGTSATLPVEMLRTAEAAAKAINKSHRPVEAVLVSRTLDPVPSPSGFPFLPTHTIATAPHCDLINLPALWRNPRPAIQKNKECISWLRDSINHGSLITAVGTGVCFLAETGMLNGLAATTHWHYFDQFQKDYPAVALKRQYFTTRAGNFYCAASVNAMAELMVHLCYRLYGRRVASVVERNFFHEIRNTFEPNSFFSEQVSKHHDEQILQAQIWLDDNYASPINLGELATKFGFRQRSFNRRFKIALGKTPSEYLQDVRLTNARELLGKSNVSIQETANLCGYQSASTFARKFRESFHTSPKKYRETVRGKLFSASAPD